MYTCMCMYACACVYLYVGICLCMLVVYAYVYTHMQMVKCLPAMRKTWVRSLGQEDPLEKEMATHSNTLAWRIPRMEEPGGLQSTGSQRVGRD